MLGMHGGPRRRGRVLRASVSVAFAAVLGGAVLSACSSSGSGGNAITLYNGQHPQTTQELVSAFFEKSTGITVNVRNGDENALANEIVTEGANSPADVYYTENSPPLEYLQGKGLLEPVDSSTLAETPSQYNSPKGDWVGVSARSASSCTTRADQSDELPSSVLDLADAKYRGKLALAPSETDFQPIVTSVDRQDGNAATQRWLEGLKSNASAHIYPDNETIVDEVNRGAVAMGVINQYYWYRLQAELGASGMHSKLAYLRRTIPATSSTCRVRRSSGRPPTRPTPRGSWPFS